MSHSSSHDISRQVKIYLVVFSALLAGTIVTVVLNAVHFEDKRVTFGVALFVAVVKAFLVAGFFMHLISERKAIYAILLATVFFFSGLMYLTVWAHSQLPVGTVYHGTQAARPVPSAVGAH